MQRGYSYDTNLILRTLYLEREVDNKLCFMAENLKVGKNEVIKDILEVVLSDGTLQEIIEKRITAKGTPVTVGKSEVVQEKTFS